MSLTVHEVTNLEELLLLFRVLEEQFNLIHKIGLWKLNVRKTRLRKQKKTFKACNLSRKSKKKYRIENMTRLLALFFFSLLKESNLCCPSGHEGLDPVQMQVNGFSVCYLLGPTQFQNHLKQQS